MPSYQAPIADTTFLLQDVFPLTDYQHLSGFAELTPDLLTAILQEGGKFAAETLQPLNRIGDQQGCTRADDNSVTTPEGFREAYQTFREGGWVGLAMDPDYGGQGLPRTLAVIINEYLSSANMSFAMYPGLSQGACAALHKYGADELKARYLPKMVAGEWTGTMNLTEPHCGTDLGLLRTKAEANGDGSYAITGTKIFISAGEHDLTDNIIHLVLARIEGAPAGVKGISLFLVPKFLPDEAGEPGMRNGVACGALEEKMGIHGNATCVMNYDQATGWLIGEEHNGLKAMFTMMNEARIGVAVQGLAQSEVGYQNAVAYAKDRLQGRALTGARYPDQPADPLLVHPDVRRTLLRVRAFNEAARALIIWSSLKSDVAHMSTDKQEVSAARDLLGLMTPVAKGVMTDLGFDNVVAAQQMFGGHGYIAEWGMEQFVRDARIAMIYEGANGIQALDLVGRKLPANGGRAIMAYFAELDRIMTELGEQEAMVPLLAGLKKGAEDLQQATVWFMQNALEKPDHAGAGSVDYMHLLGLVAMGHMWVLMAASAAKALQGNPDDPAFYEDKRLLARFFMERMMPETAMRRARIEAGADTVMALDEARF